MSESPSSSRNAECEVRPVTAADSERLYELGLLLATLPLLSRYGVRPDRFASELRTFAEGDVPQTGSDGQHVLVAEQPESGELLGMARVLCGGGSWGTFGRSGYLKLIALRSGCEGRGIGQKMLQGVEALVARRSPDLFLLTSDFNHGAQRFYERSGYARVGALPDFVCSGITEIIYWKKLPK